LTEKFVLNRGDLFGNITLLLNWPLRRTFQCANELLYRFW